MEADADAEGDADVVALGFFAAAGVLPPSIAAVMPPMRPRTHSAGKADAEPLAERALPSEPHFPLLLEPFPCAPALALPAARQGCQPPIYRD